MEKILFKEEQGMNHPRLIIVLPVLFFVIVIYAISLWVPFSYHGHAIDWEDVSYYEFLIFGVVIFLILGLLLAYVHNCKLKTKISDKRIWISYPPFKGNWKKLSKAQIKTYQIRRYRPWREYYGHGFRNHWMHGMSYTISGNIGLQLYLKNGKKILIGTQQKQGIEYAMEKMMKRENSSKNG